MYKRLHEVQDNLLVTNTIIVKQEDVVPSLKVGYSLVMEKSGQNSYITYQGLLRPVNEIDVDEETIQFGSSIDVLITFRCSITGEEG